MEGWAQLRLQTCSFKVVRLDMATQNSQRMCSKRSRWKLQDLLRPNLGNTRKILLPHSTGQGNYYGQPTFEVKGIRFHLSVESMVKNVRPSSTLP